MMEQLQESDSLAAGWEALGRCFEWMQGLCDSRGKLVCPEHRVEHSGKNAGLIPMALELARRSHGAARERLVQCALRQGERLLGNLKREDTSECFTFRPGRHDPFNCSNSVIDGGAAADALGALVRELEAECSGERLAPFRAASLKHARTYLRYAVLDKGVPAQRAWGLCGLASAWRLEQDPILMQAAREAFELLQDIQHPDGSFPYHPLEWGAEHVGASDVSAFYQSRVSTFCMWAAADLGWPAADDARASSFRRGLDFLLALQGPDGIKCGLVEAKPWYWGANYEVASHPFDVAALALGWRLFGEARYAEGALRSLRAWTQHLCANGEPRSHLPGNGRGRSYQCSVFWAGHAMWIARALPLLEDYCQTASAEQAPSAPAATFFEQASLVRLEDERVVAWVRGARPGSNMAHGSPQGAGLIGVLRKSDGRDLLPRCPRSARQVGEWSGRAGHFSPLRGWNAGAQELRFSLWLARVHWRAGRPGAALAAPLVSFRRGLLAFAESHVSSAFQLEAQLELSSGASVQLTSSLAWRAGGQVPGARLERSFEVDGRGLVVHEQLLEAPGVGGLDYSVPELATELQRTGNQIRYRLT